MWIRLGHTGGRPHRSFVFLFFFPPPSFCGACQKFSREKDSAVPYPRRQRSRILCTHNIIVQHLLAMMWEKIPVRVTAPRFDHIFYCMVTRIARVWINRVRLPILLVVSWTGKMNISLSGFAPENLVSRDGFGSPVPRQPAHLHTQAEFGAYLRDSSRIPRRRPFIYLNRPPYAIESVPSLWGHTLAYNWRSLPRVRWHRANKPQGSSERVLP